ncbi:MAG: tyrosine-type recombinase/integrase [Paracoccaceae bacterium]
MPKQKLTKRTIDATEPTGKEFVVWDTQLSGFGLKVTKAGSKSFIYRYRMGGRGYPDKRVTIGSVGSGLTADEARKSAELNAFKVRQGIDPQQEKKRGQQDAHSLAFDKYVEHFVSHGLAKDWKKSGGEAARLLRREAVPQLGHNPLPEIQKRDVTRLFDKLADRPGIARNTATALSKLFRWAVARGDLAQSPMEGILWPEKAPVRARYLDDIEITALWEATQAISHPYARLVRLLLLTGQRRDEVGEMVWEEVDIDAQAWFLPAARAKNGQAHTVPLAAAALAELVGQEIEGCAYVFTASGSQPIQNWSYWKKKLDREFDAVMEDRGHMRPERWKLHDLRRTVATGMQRIGVANDVVEAFHNRQVRQGVAGRYQHHDYPAEKKMAAEAWSSHLMALVAKSDPNL